mmetsp:Transcript_27577/g.67075  ORF Transcript_27577/g.67075 Transcript_27577/m.67075 type:complete len:274 (+) Transcript_27577:695-1516(+)
MVGWRHLAMKIQTSRNHHASRQFTRIKINVERGETKVLLSNSQFFRVLSARGLLKKSKCILLFATNIEYSCQCHVILSCASWRRLLMLEFVLVHVRATIVTPISYFLLIRLFLHLYFDMGNQQSIKHEPLSPYHNATSTKAPAIKSAMKRSRSIRHHALDGEKQKRYIPNMPINPNSSGLVMPSRPYHGKDTPPPTGEFSPQWGWYTSLTPPSDAMYASAKSHQQHHKRSASEPARVAIPPPEIIRDENQANQVFQTLQNSHAPVGWRTSVPI